MFPVSLHVVLLQKVSESPVIHRNEEIFHPVGALTHKQHRFNDDFSYSAHVKRQASSDLLGSDEFVIPELGELRAQRDVAVHQERLATALVEILERQSCTNNRNDQVLVHRSWIINDGSDGVSPVYAGLSLFSS